jgi:hypothetical protein
MRSTIAATHVVAPPWATPPSIRASETLVTVMYLQTMIAQTDLPLTARPPVATARLCDVRARGVVDQRGL